MGTFRTLLFALPLLLVACGGDSTPAPPGGLSYYYVAFEVGQSFSPLEPQVAGVVSQYAVSPALPAGLVLNSSTGVLSGTPQVVAPSTTYTFTASNSGGGSSYAWTFAVEQAPSGLSYASPVHVTAGAAITALAPTLSGNADFYSIALPLPAGLTLDSKTGIISGTPGSERPQATYTVVASDLAGSTATFDLNLAVDPPPPGTVLTGRFRDSTVIGLGYRSGSHAGVTGSEGQFQYEVGQSVSFYVGNVLLGTVPVPGSLLTPVDLVAGGTGSSTYVLNVVRLLMLLDRDGDPSNGLELSAAVTASAATWPAIDFNTTDLPGALAPIIVLANAADGVVHSLPDAASAALHLRNGYFCEHAGVYVGTYSGAVLPGDSSGMVAAAVLPDGTISTDFNPPWNSSADPPVSLSAMSPALDATFAPSLSNLGVANVRGTFAEEDFLSGTFPITGPLQTNTVGTVSAARLGSAPSAKHRLIGRFVSSTLAEGDTDWGPVIIEIDDANVITGGVYDIAVQTWIPVTGTLSGTQLSFSSGLVSHATVDLGTLTFSGSEPSSATRPYTTVSGTGCRLH